MKPLWSLFWSQPTLCSCALRALGQHPQSPFISLLVENRHSAVGLKGSGGRQTPLLSGTLALPSWESNDPTLPLSCPRAAQETETAASVNAQTTQVCARWMLCALRSMGFRLFAAGCVLWLFVEAQGTRGLRFQLPWHLPPEYSTFYCGGRVDFGLWWHI